MLALVLRVRTEGHRTCLARSWLFVRSGRTAFPRESVKPPAPSRGGHGEREQARADHLLEIARVLRLAAGHRQGRRAVPAPRRAALSLVPHQRWWGQESRGCAQACG